MRALVLRTDFIPFIIIVLNMMKIEKNKKINAVTSAVILCAGTGDRWNNYLGIPKQLIEIGGETLLDRAIRLLKRDGVSDIHVVTHNQLLKQEGIKNIRTRKI